ncbi:MAG: phosphatidate cytidylyltransferase [Burkholderiales bacterium]
MTETIKRVLSALVVLALFLPALFFLPRPYWAAMLFIGAFVALREWGRLCGFSATSRGSYLIATAFLGWFAYAWLQPYRYGVLLHAPAAAFWVIIVPMWLYSKWHITSKPLLAVIGWLVVLPAWLALVTLREISAPFLLAVLGVVWIADSAAFMVGKTWGKNKLAPIISPSKTWEGVAGAMVAVSGYAALIAYAPWLAADLPGVRDAWLWVIMAACLIAALSILGDLFESWMKRQAGMKNSGTSLPGHGGVLDRIDSLTSSLPIVVLAAPFAGLSVLR